MWRSDPLVLPSPPPAPQAAKHDEHHDDHHGHHDHRVFNPPYNPWGAPCECEGGTSLPVLPVSHRPRPPAAPAVAVLLFIVVGGLATSVIALVVGMWNTWKLGRFFGGK